MRTEILTAALLAMSLAPVGLPRPRRAQVPFLPGESLEYRVSSSRFGDFGHGRMSVSGPVEVRCHSTLLLSLEIDGEIAFLDFEDATRAWLDPALMVSLRYRKEEDHPLGGRSEAIEIFPEQGRWTDEQGDEGLLMTDRPLDELSMIYFLRTLALVEDSTLTLSRHFDPVRNPVRVRLTGTERVTVPAGSFQALAIVMTVRDDRRYGRERGRIEVHLSDDARRLPLRIESSAPLLGRVTMELEAVRDEETTRRSDGRQRVAGAPPGGADRCADPTR